MCLEPLGERFALGEDHILIEVRVLVEYVRLHLDVASVDWLVEQVPLFDRPEAEGVRAEQKDTAPEVDVVVALRQPRSVDHSPESLLRVVDHLRHRGSHTSHLILETGRQVAHCRWLVGGGWQLVVDWWRGEW